MPKDISFNPQQTEALSAIKAFLKSKGPIFILKGSAGTGKTTLVQAICQHLKKAKTSFKLTATTGRAAKILSAKTGVDASTLHGLLYVFDEVAGNDTSGANPWESKTGQLFLNFGLRQSSNRQEHPDVIIVDEASKISHLTQTATHTAVFGSGNLLNDLLSFVGKSKLIFVGDACQLPPVAKESLSAALSQAYWMQRGKVAHQYELTHIVRQQAGNEILEIAGGYRQHILQPQGDKLLSFPQPLGRQVFATVGKDAFLQEYIQLCQQYGLTEAVTMCHSNRQAYELNRYVRQQRHGRTELQPGELLMVVQNSYNVSLINGDQVEVEEVQPDCQRAGFTFLKVKVKSVFNGQVYETRLIQELLYTTNPGLTADETKNLLIDFDYRMRNRNIKRNSAAFKSEMLKDPYLNALRAKFGYAITVHKAQGGEWRCVFLYLNTSIYALVYSGKDGKDKFHRWFYTAITRASEKLVVNDCTLVSAYFNRHPGEKKSNPGL